VADDQFGGPEPDNARFTGVILRLNEDGSAPADNPFFALGAEMGGEVGANLQKVYVYGIRNSFGMAFDPLSGGLWYQVNGEDAYDELNRAEAGANDGWIQIMGPLERVPDYRQIGTTSLHNEDFPNLQQLRWGPERIASTSEEAVARLFQLPGSHYSDPEFSWRLAIAPAGIGFVGSKALGPSFEGDLFVGLAVPAPLDGPLLRFPLTSNRQEIAAHGPGLKDRVDDNPDFNELGETADLVVGTGFGIVTDLETAPNGNLYAVSISLGAVYEISGKPHGPKLQAAGAPAALALSPYPNPARGATSVGLVLAEPTVLEAEVYDARGSLVRRLGSAAPVSGRQQVTWDGRAEDGSAMPAGIYLIRVRAAGSEGSARIVLLD
jgi:hypothetical protein